MKKLTLVLLIGISLVVSGCTESKDVLKEDRYSLMKEKRKLESEIVILQNESDLLAKQIEHDQKLIENEKIDYLLELEVKESHVNVLKLYEDTLKKYRFTIPVTKEFYEAQEIGTEIVNDFRLRRVHITVVDKTLEYPKDDENVISAEVEK